MKVKSQYLSKSKVEYCIEDYSMEVALEKLYSSGYRCIPVLDEKGKKYLGNVYKVHILEYEKKGRDMTSSIMEVVKNQEGFMSHESSFSKIFNKIKELPYVAVVDEEECFLGILTHKNVIEMLEDSWGVKNGSYSLTISASESSGSLEKLISLIKKTSDIQSLITLDGNSKLLRRVEVTLPKGITEKDLEKINARVLKAGYRVVDIEKL